MSKKRTGRDTYYVDVSEKSNFDRMKRWRKRRELVIDMLFTIAAMIIVALGIAVVITS